MSESNNKKKKKTENKYEKIAQIEVKCGKKKDDEKN